MGDPPAPSGAVDGQLLEGPERVFVAYVPGMLRVGSCGHSTRAVDVSASATDYWAMLGTIGRRDVRFVLIEQDMLPPLGSIDALLRCARPWCAHSYHVPGGSLWDVHGHPGLGLSAFAPGVLAPLADTERIRWTDLDWRVAEMLTRQGVECHRHYPDAEHLHDYAAPRG